MRTVMLALCVTLAAVPAHADDKETKASKAKAKQLYDEGLRHFNVAEYADAITAWKEAYLLTKKPLLLFNLGQAFRLSGDCKQAVTFYDTYVQEEPAPKNQEELDQAVALCKDKPGDKPVTRPGDKQVVTTTPGGSKVEPVKPVDPTIAHAGVQPVGVLPVATPAQPSRPAEVREEGAGGHAKRTAGLVIGIAGVALDGIAVYFAVAGHRQQAKLDSFTGAWTSTQVDQQAVGQRDSKLAYVFGGVGAAALVVGTILYVVGGNAEHAPAVSFGATRGGADVAWSTQF